MVFSVHSGHSLGGRGTCLTDLWSSRGNGLRQGVPGYFPLLEGVLPTDWCYCRSFIKISSTDQWPDQVCTRITSGCANAWPPLTNPFEVSSWCGQSMLTTPYLCHRPGCPHSCAAFINPFYFLAPIRGPGSHCCRPGNAPRKWLTIARLRCPIPTHKLIPWFIRKCLITLSLCQWCSFFA